MKYFKYLASLPILISLIAGAYGTLNYINKLTAQIDESTDTINILKVEVENLEQRIYGDIDNIHAIFNDKTSRNSNNYASAREELVKEMADMASWVGRIEGIVAALRDGSYKLASQAEYQALEELVRTNSDAIRQIGYDTYMIFVNTSLDVALERNKKRERSVPEYITRKSWSAVQANIGRFQNLFGRHMYIVDNSDGANYQGATMSVYRRIGAWTREPVANHRARTWVKAQKKLRGIKEEDIGRNRTTMRNRIGKSSMQRKAEKRRAKLAQLAPKDPVQEDIKDMDMGEVIKDFQKSDAPQFKGKSKEKKRQMAIAAKLSTEEQELDEAPRWMLDPLAKTIHRNKYNVAKKILKQVYDRKKREGGGRTRHGIEWYALNVAGQVSDKIDARTLANMVREEYDSDIHHWGTPEGTQHYKDMTPGQGDTEYKQNNSDDAVSDAPNDFSATYSVGTKITVARHRNRKMFSRTGQRARAGGRLSGRFV